MKKEVVARLPEHQPIRIGPFTLTETGMNVRGRPTFEQYEAVGIFIKRTHAASGWWLADWLRYGEGREDWREKLSQAQDATGLTEKTLKNVRAIGAIEPSRRRQGVEFALHAEVAGLEPDEQTHWLTEAEAEGWDRRELRVNIRAAKRAKVIEGQAILEGMYRILYADPPWLYDDSGPTFDGSLGKAERHYRGMTVQELCALPIAAHAMPDSTLFLWATTPMLLQTPGPREVIEAWGFTYKSERIWDKVLGMPGHYALDLVHEHLLICTRGNGQPIVPTPHEKSILVERRSNIHSRKPESIRKWIEKHWTAGPYLELFGRERVDGWSVFGDDAALWAEDAATVNA
jgi:N6-adenosine-specific RNA methylase IME4